MQTLTVEVQKAFLRLSKDAMAQGSMLDSLRYLAAQVHALGARLDRQIQTIESGDLLKLQQTPQVEAKPVESES